MDGMGGLECSIKRFNCHLIQISFPGNQMFPKIVGNDSLLRELQLSGRRFTSVATRPCYRHTPMLFEALQPCLRVLAPALLASAHPLYMLPLGSDLAAVVEQTRTLTW